MINLGSTQVKFAGKLSKQKKAAATRNPLKSNNDLPISSEMIELMEKSLFTTDENDCLPENVASNFSQPLNSLALFCPQAAIMESVEASRRFPERTNRNQSEWGTNPESEQNNNSFLSTSMKSIGMMESTFRSPSLTFGRTWNTQKLSESSVAVEETPKIDDAKSRLQVLWLQRKAQLAYEDGKITESVAILDEAVTQHLGTSDYLKAKLSEPVLSNDPEGLIEDLNKSYFIYDEKIHMLASKIQRFCHKKHLYKAKKITDIAKVFRGFLGRKRVKELIELRKQCARKIQKRFRVHLIKINALATFLKQWFKLRKEVKEFNKRLNIFRMVRRIQRLFRGKKAREFAKMRKYRLDCILRIQRNGRGYIFRRNRAFVIMLIHRQYFYAARKIQTFIRGVQAVHRSQLKLLLEVTRENIRNEKEMLVVEETLKMAKIRNHFYLKTDAGKIHLQFINRQLAAKRQEIARIAPTLDEDDLITQRVINVLEQYDVDGVGKIKTSKLKLVLEKLCIVMNLEDILHLAAKLDGFNTGSISFVTFIEWFFTEDADGFIEPETFLGNLKKLKLEMREKINRLTLKNENRILEKEFHKQYNQWLRKDSVVSFRETHPPKYQCCQCLQAFVMFTDYRDHFDPSNGDCLVLKVRGMFFSKYWLQEEWLKQREIEREIMRKNSEQPFIEHRCVMECCREVSLSKLHAPLRKLTKDLYLKAFITYKERFTELLNKKETVSEDSSKKKKFGKLKRMTIRGVLEMVKTLSDSFLRVFLMDGIAQTLNLPIRKKWVFEGFCTNKDIQEWLEFNLPDKELKGDELSYMDNAVNKKLTDYLNPKAEQRNKSEFMYISHGQISKLPGKETKTYLLGKREQYLQRARELAEIYVRVLRLRYVEIQQELLSLLEFRSRLPRRITLNDQLLESLELHSLTESHYCDTMDKLRDQLQKIRAKFSQLQGIEVPKRCSSFNPRRLLSLMLLKPTYTAVEPLEDPQQREREFKVYLFSQAKERASADKIAYLRGVIGQSVLRLISSDLETLWHNLKLPSMSRRASLRKEDQLTLSELSPSGNSNMNIAGSFVERQFLYARFASTVLGEGMSTRDLDLLAADLTLKIPEKSRSDVLMKLDPQGTGLVSFFRFTKWVSSEALMDFRSQWMGFKRGLRVLDVRRIRWSLFLYQAEMALLLLSRRLERLRLEVVEDLAVGPALEEPLEGVESSEKIEGSPGSSMKKGSAKNKKTQKRPKSGGKKRRISEDGELARVMRECVTWYESVEQLLQPFTGGFGFDAQGGVGDLDPLVAVQGLFHISKEELEVFEAEEAEEKEKENKGGSEKNKGLNGSNDENTVVEAPAVLDRNLSSHKITDREHSLRMIHTGEEENENEQAIKNLESHSSDEINPLNPTISPIKPTRRSSADRKKLTKGVSFANFTENPETSSKKEKPNPQPTRYKALLQWFRLRWQREEDENRVLFTTVEQRARRNFFRTFFTPKSRYQRRAEKAYVECLDEMAVTLSFYIYRDNLPDAIEEAKSVLPATGVSQKVSSFADSVKIPTSAIITSNPVSPVLESSKVRRFSREQSAMMESIHEEDSSGFSEVSLGGSIDTFGATAFDRGDSITDSKQGENRFSLFSKTVDKLSRAACHAHVLRTCLEMYVSSFDSDCAGQLSESEIRSLISCLQLNQGESSFRTFFSGWLGSVGNAAGDQGFVDIRKVSELLYNQVEWKLSEKTTEKNGFKTNDVTLALNHVSRAKYSRLLLIAMQQRRMRGMAEQSVKLSRMGRVLLLGKKRVSGVQELRHKSSLLFRAQVYAVRQVKAFLKTTHGEIEKFQQGKTVIKKWNLLVAGIAEDAPVVSPVVPVAEEGSFEGSVEVSAESAEFSESENSTADERSLSTRTEPAEKKTPPLHTVANYVDIVHYSYWLHSIDSGGMLNTELPHFLQFLIVRMGFTGKPSIHGVAVALWTPNPALQAINHSHVHPHPFAVSIQRLTFTEALDIVLNVLKAPGEGEVKAPLKHKLDWIVDRKENVDSSCKMLSCARQQAVLISMQIEDVHVPETNYRCAVLGLHLVMDVYLRRSVRFRGADIRGKKTDISEKGEGFVENGQERTKQEETLVTEEEKVVDVEVKQDLEESPKPPEIKWKPGQMVPKEAICLFLLSFGYSKEDLLRDELKDFVSLLHGSSNSKVGSLNTDLCDTSQVRETARVKVSKPSTWTESYHRFGRRVVKGRRFFSEFEWVVHAIQRHGKLVDRSGGIFLKEILRGVSHCGELE